MMPTMWYELISLVLVVVSLSSTCSALVTPLHHHQRSPLTAADVSQQGTGHSRHRLDCRHQLRLPPTLRLRMPKRTAVQILRRATGGIEGEQR
jgi:hypothetical protein